MNCSLTHAIINDYVDAVYGLDVHDHIVQSKEVDVIRLDSDDCDGCARWLMPGVGVGVADLLFVPGG